MVAGSTCERAVVVTASCPTGGVRRDKQARINSEMRGTVRISQTSMAELHEDPFGYKLFEAVAEFATTSDGQNVAVLAFGQ
ncbi:hypothetical protein SAMN04488583_3959 [Mycobacterium sp. 88mf]|nr:hypothetical protein SAMN04488583_3959 [Mycobacterium sp. 88mf]SFF92099.1 hypothetical protein SAMN04488582_104705 [Mycobacterium sp. 455mf]